VNVFGRLFAALMPASCCGRVSKGEVAGGVKKIALVGSPNVGKSVMWNNLTGAYVTVSNYPGTTVEIARGACVIEGEHYEVVDTPGMYSMMPLSEDERVARRIIIEEKPDVVLHLADATNLERMLPLTFQLVEAGLPVMLVLNMMDEAEAKGLSIDVEALEQELGIPVVGTVSTTGRGMDELRRKIARAHFAGATVRFRYSSVQGVQIEDYLRRIEERLSGDYAISQRCLAILLLQGDQEIHRMVRHGDESAYEDIRSVVEEVRQSVQHPFDYTLALQRRKWASSILSRVVSSEGAPRRSFSERLSRLLTHPVTGIPIGLLVLYLALYRFVGVFGAGTVVDFLEGTVFGTWVSPVVERAVQYVIPWGVLRDLIAGEYGMITLGLRYAVALILPIVTFFFLVFSFIEDVGYLPRLALLLDRVFKKIGLSGRAVIPMVLGFGCATMATLVTRTLSTRRERLIAILLLSVAVPCSAQLGVIIALLSTVPGAFPIWAVVIGAVYIATGSAASHIIPGRSAPFYIEVPPLRWPKISNILTKTFARVKWYFKEVIPLFLLASVFIWLGQLTGLFPLLIKALKYPVQWLGLPAQAAEAFLFGFFRRDYGAAGLYDVQLVVAAVALTLFLPCIAQFLMNLKEKGWAGSAAIMACALGISFVTAFALFHLLSGFGITLAPGA